MLALLTIVPIWLVKALSSPNFVPTSPNVRQTEVEYRCPNSRDPNMLHTYSGWDTKKVFKGIVDSAYAPLWIHMGTILCAWKS